MKSQKSKVKSQKYGSFLKKTVIFFTCYLLLFTLSSPVYAAVNIGEQFGFGDLKSLGQATSQLVMPLFSVASTLVVIYFLWGAFNFLKSGGNKEEVAGARNMITHAIIGFIILIFAFLILQFLLSNLFGITNPLLF